jgi:hypothetical protein
MCARRVYATCAAIRRSARAALAMSAAAVILFCAHALADEPAIPSRFDYCAPPFTPACVGSAFRNSEELARCEADTERYVAMVFAYRNCLAAQTERVVREANETIRKMRCAHNPASCQPSGKGPRR